MSEEIRKDNLHRPPAKEARWLVGIVGIVTAVRIMVLLFRGTDLNTDPDAYVALAKTIADTGGFHSPGTTIPTAFRPPLYPLTIAALMSTGLTATAAVSCIAVMAGAGVTIAAWWMARVCGLRTVWSGLAAFAVGMDPLLLRYSSLPMTETLSAGLLTVGVLQIVKLLPSPDHTNNPRTHSPMKSAATAGLYLGLAGLCRPICFLTCAVLTCGLLLYCVFRRKSEHGDRLTITTAALPAVVAGLMLTPWIVRNAVRFQDFLPLTTHGGYTLLLGNNSTFYRDVVNAPGQPVWSQESLTNWQNNLNDDMQAAGAVTEIEKDSWMYTRAKQEILDDLPTFRRACILRWKRFWAVRPRVTGSVVPGWVIGLVGMWYLLQWAGLAATLYFLRVRDDILILWLTIASFLLLHSFYWTNTRMRAPLTGVIVVLVALGWQHLFEYFFVRKKLKS